MNKTTDQIIKDLEREVQRLRILLAARHNPYILVAAQSPIFGGFTKAELGIKE